MSDSTNKSIATVEVRREYADQPAHKEIIKRNVNALKATVIGLSGLRKRKGDVQGKGASSGESKAGEIDTFTRLEREGRIVPPPFDLLTLAVMPENNTELGPAIEAMSVNIESFGWDLKPRLPINEQTPVEVKQTLLQERIVAENFFANAFQDHVCLEDFRECMRKDLESTGNAYTEFVQLPGTGELDGLNHLPSWTMRISRVDHEPTQYVDLRINKLVRFGEVIDVPENLEDFPDLQTQRKNATPVQKRDLNVDLSFEIQEQIRFKKFRRYVQVIEGTTTWFKELGDPRLISCIDGKAVTQEMLRTEHLSDESMPRFTLNGNTLIIRSGKVGFPVKWAANPVKHHKLYSSRSVYGLPRWTGHLFCIFGSRASEEMNYTTFKNNQVPSMVVTVTNGNLTDDSIERMEEFVEATIASDDNYSKMLLLEAEPMMDGMRDPGAMKIEIKPLTREQHTDAMFVEYQKSNDEKVRRAFRFPPVFVGLSSDFTGKTIEASRKLGDEQVFGPERKKVDRFFTKDILLRLGIAWSEFRSKSPDVVENQDLIRILAQGEKTGALTPRISRNVFSRVMNEDLGDVDADLVPPDQPFSLTLAQLMKSDSVTSAPGGGEPGSQGRLGTQVAGPGRDRSQEPAFDDLESDRVENLKNMIRAEVKGRFGGFLPPAFRDDGDDEMNGDDLV